MFLFLSETWYSHSSFLALNRYSGFVLFLYSTNFEAQFVCGLFDISTY